MASQDLTKPCDLQVIDRLEKMVRDVKKGNGYYNTIEQVNTVNTSPEQINDNFPAVNIDIGDIEYITATRNEAGILSKKLPIVFDILYEAKDEEEKTKLFTKFVADFDVRFGDDTPGGNKNYNMVATAYNLENLVLTSEATSAIRRDLEGYDLSLCRYSMWVGYRQSRKNPNQFYYGL